MSQPSKSLPKWPVFIIIFVILALFVLNPFCRYLYTKDFVERGDKQLAELLAHDFETEGITGTKKPVFFIGAKETLTNASCLDLSSGKYDIFSVFAAADALQLDTVEASRYIVSYLNELGYTYTAPTSEDYAKYASEFSEEIPLEKAFPWYSSILETDNCIVVQLTQIPDIPD